MLPPKRPTPAATTAPAAALPSCLSPPRGPRLRPRQGVLTQGHPGGRVRQHLVSGRALRRAARGPAAPGAAGSAAQRRRPGASGRRSGLPGPGGSRPEHQWLLGGGCVGRGEDAGSTCRPVVPAGSAWGWPMPSAVRDVARRDAAAPGGNLRCAHSYCDWPFRPPVPAIYQADCNHKVSSETNKKTGQTAAITL